MVTRVVRFDWHRLEYSFRDAVHSVAVPKLFLLAAGVGLVGGIYGIGGGAILAPVIVSLWGLPVYTVAGAALLGTCLTSVAGVGLFSTIGWLGDMPEVMPSWSVGLAFGVGGLFGTYTGSQLQHLLPPRPIDALLALIVNGLGLSYIIGYFTR